MKDPCSKLRRCRNGAGLIHLAPRAQAAAGQSSVEFIGAAFVLFFLICLAMDFGRMFFVQANVQQAVQEGARYASIGTHESGTDPNTGQPYSRIQSINNTIQQDAVGAEAMGVVIPPAQISSALGGTGSAGGPQDIETVAVTVSLALWTPVVAQLFSGGNYTFTASATIKNEPFPPGQTK